MRTKQFIPESLKREIVYEVLTGNITKEQARRIYGLKGKSGVLNWMRKFASIDPKAYGTDPLPKLKTMKQETIELKARIKELEEELTRTKLKARAYQIMVENAEKYFGIDLGKKRGAKQFNN